MWNRFNALWSLKPGDISYSLSTRFGGRGLGLILTHKFFCLVAQPFQAVRKSLAQVENLCHQKLVESTTSPLMGNA